MRHNPAMAERREMIIALLEERPYRTVDLASALELASGMHQVCAQLAREGTVTRLPDGSWALPGHQPAAVAPPAATTRRLIDGEAVLAQLRGGPKGCTAMAKALNVGKHAVQNRLDALAAAGAVRSIGQHTGLRWVLADWTPPVVERRPMGRPRTRPQVEKVVELEGDNVDEELAGDVDPDAAIVDEEMSAPVRERLLGEGRSHIYPAGTRQVVVKKLKVAEAPAWWVQFAAPDKRAEFMTAAAARDAEMQKSPGWRSQTKVNQEPRG